MPLYYLNPFASHKLPDWYLENFPLGIVEEQVLSTSASKRVVRVRFKNAYWKARSIELGRTNALVPGQRVRIVGRQNSELIVAPVDESPSYRNRLSGSPRRSSNIELPYSDPLSPAHKVLDEADARIEEMQSTIQSLRKETEKDLANLAEVIDSL